jgi:predicted nucleic acid-binding protein
MSARIFLDTKTLIYILEGREAGAGITLTAIEREANRKGDITLGLLEQNSIIVGVQVFNELCNVVLRRSFDWVKAQELLATLEALCDEIVPLSLAVHKKGLLLRDKYQLQLFDAMLLAAALAAKCTVFYSEDMQDGQVIEHTLTIKNPFKNQPKAL